MRPPVDQVKVIDVPQAWSGLHGRAVLLVSLPALQLLNREQLQALVAHEIGHEYWWDAWGAAQREDDQDGLRTLEARCDAVAVLALTALGLPAERLSSALGVVYSFNRGPFGVARNETHYPTLQERRRAVQRFSETGR